MSRHLGQHVSEILRAHVFRAVAIGGPQLVLRTKGAHERPPNHGGDFQRRHLSPPHNEAIERETPSLSTKPLELAPDYLGQLGVKNEAMPAQFLLPVFRLLFVDMKVAALSFLRGAEKYCLPRRIGAIGHNH